MQHFEAIVADYLSRPTEYALQLSGGWGNGKTWYYRNRISNCIATTSLYNNAEKKYKPLYISLFGLKSVDEIDQKMIFDFFGSSLFSQYQKNGAVKRQVKVTESLFKMVIRGFMAVTRLGNTNDWFVDISAVGKEVLDNVDLVICFDDLERKDSQLKLSDLIGYINALVDEGTKVLILTNEDVLKKEEGGTYLQLKEKVIGISVPFVPDIATTLENIIETRYGNFSVYRAFLIAQMPILVHLTKCATGNFRHMLYGLDCLHHIYGQIKKEILDTSHPIKAQLEAHLISIMTMAMALAIEYKNGALQHDQLHLFGEEKGTVAARLMARMESNDEEFKKGKALRDKYDIPKEHYYVYPSIFKYLTMAAPFSIPDFIEEVTEKYHLLDGEVKPQYLLLEELDEQNCFDLDDDRYMQRLESVLNYAYAGAYRLSTYLTIMKLVERFDNVFALDLAQVRSRLEAGMGLVISKGPYNPFYSFEKRGKTMHQWPETTKLYLAGLEMIQTRKDKDQQLGFRIPAMKLQDDPGNFLTRIASDNTFRDQIASIPLLRYVEMKPLMNKLKEAGGQVIYNLALFFENRYQDRLMLSQEFEPLSKLTEYFKELVTLSGGANKYSKMETIAIKQLSDVLWTAYEQARKLQATHASHAASQT